MPIHLDDRKMIERIVWHFDNATYNYAVMINGEWGCGKTYFVKNLLFDYLKKKKLEPIYLSLYGYQSIEQINNSLLTSKFFKGKHKEEKWKILKVIFSTAFSKIQDKMGLSKHLNNEDLKNIILPLFCYDENVCFIFDDVERCEIPINELFGYLNSFVEHQKQKVILVANEKEIEDKNIKDLELKYLVALQVNLIDSLNANNNEGTKDKGKILNKLNIHDDATKIFDNYTSYRNVKEKLIGATLEYKPNMHDASLNLISKNFNENEKCCKTFRDNLSFILDIFSKKGCSNLRTFQFIIEKYKDVYKRVAGQNEEYISDEEFVTNLLKNIVNVSINIKFGKNNEKNKSFMKVFINDYLQSGQWNPSKIDLVWDDFKRIGLSNSLNTAFKTLQQWSFHYEREVLDAVEIMENNLEKLSLSVVSQFLMYVVIFTNKAIISQTDYEKIYKEMEEYLVNKGVDENWYMAIDMTKVMIDNRDILSLYQSVTDSIVLKALNDNKDIDFVRELEFAEENNITILEHIKNKYHVKTNIKFFSKTDMEQLTRYLYKASPKEIQNFRILLSFFYEKNNNMGKVSDSDLQKLSDLEKLIKYDTNDRIVNIQLEYLKKQILEIIKNHSNS